MGLVRQLLQKAGATTLTSLVICRSAVGAESEFLEGDVDVVFLEEKLHVLYHALTSFHFGFVLVVRGLGDLPIWQKRSDCFGIV